jgi:hypothetical protein
MVMEDEYNEFEAAIPGQSLAGEQPMGSAPWETPADFPDPDEFYMYTQEKLLNDEDNLMNVVKLLDMQISVEAIVDGILMNSFMMGQISADTAIISKEPVTDLILLIAQEGDITPTRRDRTAEGQNEIRIEQAIASIAEEDGEGMGDEEAQEDMSLVGMMAPPDDMDMMAMEEAPQEMAVEEEDPELMEI